jgi:hypothetical protein
MHDFDLIRTTYHEAGHTIMVVWLGYEVVRVTTIPKDGKNPHVEHSCPMDIADHVMVAYSSCVCLRAFGMRDDGGAIRDFCDAENVVEKLLPGGTDEEHEALLDNLWSDTERIFEKPVVRTAIEALVKELLVHHELDGESVHALLDPMFVDAPDRPTKKG